MKKKMSKEAEMKFTQLAVVIALTELGGSATEEQLYGRCIIIGNECKTGAHMIERAVKAGMTKEQILKALVI